MTLKRAWFDGRVVDYVTTDVSDAAMARELGVNFVPRLAAALPPAGSPPGTPSSVDLVYMFPGREQLNVFPSAATPAGAANADQDYSPLWNVVMVRRVEGRPVRTLTSQEAVLEAAEKGEVELVSTRIVVNCPVVRSSDGTALKGVR